jgi:cysteine desulfurase
MTGPIYLDYAATAPLSEAARAAWLRWAPEVGNPSSLHGPGRAARAGVEEAREQVADLLGASPMEVVFTSGGTEANNLAVLGVARARRAQTASRRRVLVSAVEHHSVLEAAYHLVGEGFEVVELAVDRAGRVDVDKARAIVESDPAAVALISCQWVNNENGAIQPVVELADLGRAHDIPVHTDAVQGVGYRPWRLTPPVARGAAPPVPKPEGTFGVPLDQSSGVAGPTGRAADPGASSGIRRPLIGPPLDLLTISAHKLGGPVGVGALVARRDLAIDPIGFGGGQERRLRSGTVPVALIAAFAAALAETVEHRDAETGRLGDLSNRLRAGVADLGGIVVGPSDPDLRAPHIVHALFPSYLGDDLLLLLDRAGIACSTGSACSAGVAGASHVLLAMGYDEAGARSALRFSLGARSAAADVDILLAALAEILAGLGEEAPLRHSDGHRASPSRFQGRHGGGVPWPA